MQIAVASGKGGTGKTTIATSLALSLRPLVEVCYVDCDVEAPNGHISLSPSLERQTEAVIRIPQIDQKHCSLCGKCVEVCQFHAVVKAGKTIMVFPQLCHGCGSCTWNCPEQAIQEIPNPIGLLEAGMTETGICFSRGVLTISEPMPTPVIRQLKRLINSPEDTVVILDAPPGASCSVVETLRKTDFALLVTEPTPFGLHDLKQMVRIVQEMRIPAGVVVNRVNGAYDALDQFCSENRMPVLMRIPYDRLIAEGVARGQTLIDVQRSYIKTFQDVFGQIRAMCDGQSEQQSHDAC